MAQVSWSKIVLLFLITVPQVSSKHARRHEESAMVETGQKLHEIEDLLNRARELEDGNFVTKALNRAVEYVLQNPELDADQADFLVLGEFGALLTDAAYAGCCSPKETDPERLKEAIQQHLNSRLTAEADFEPQVARVFTNIEAETLMYSGTANLDLDGKSGKRKTGFLAFRGTVGSLTGPNWLGNLKSFIMDSNNLPSGMKANFDTLEGQINDLVRAAAGLEDSFENLETALPGGLLVVGHSLGGVFATYAMLDIITSIGEERSIRGLKVTKEFPPGYFRIMTYGQPRDFSFPTKRISLDNKLGEIKTRFVNEGDVVPRLPPLLGISTSGINLFLHTGKAVFMDEAYGSDELIVRATDASHNPDFTGRYSTNGLAMITETTPNVVAFHRTTRYMRNLDLARRRLGDTRDLFVITELKDVSASKPEAEE